MAKSDSAADARLWMCSTAIVDARDMPHIIITNRKYTPIRQTRRVITRVLSVNTAVLIFNHSFNQFIFSVSSKFSQHKSRGEQDSKAQTGTVLKRNLIK